MRTIAEKFAAALAARGEREVPGRSRKFRTFTREAAQHARPGAAYFFIGKSGALRTGDTTTGSVPCSMALKLKLLDEVK